jgi:hypothetical protein
MIWFKIRVFVVADGLLQGTGASRGPHPQGFSIRRDCLSVVLPYASFHDLQRTSLAASHGPYLTSYQAYLILAVVVGAALGHYMFNPAMNPEAVLSGGASGKGMACH